jgi:hypothetical protein
MRHTTSALCLAVAILLAGCSPIYYPNAPHTVLPVEAGEILATTGIGTNGIDVHTAATPVKNAVIAGAFSYLYIPGESSFTRHIYGELALGWSDTSGRATIGLLAGAGVGSTQTPPGSRFPWDAPTYDSGSYFRVFAQATLGSLASRRSIEDGDRANSGFTLGLRLAYVRATELWIDDRPQPATDDVFIEPHVSWQSFGETFGTTIDLGVSLTPRGGMRFHHSPLRLGVGIVYSP